MPRFDVEEGGRKFRVMAPEGSTLEQARERVRARLTSVAPPVRTQYADELSPLAGGIADTFGMTARPGARTSADTVLKPEGVADYAIREAIMAPTLAFSLPGRLAAVALMGGAEGYAKEGSLGDMGWRGLLDATVAGATEAGFGAILRGVKLPFVATKLPGIGDLAAPLERSRAGYKYYGEQISKALDLVKDRLPKGAWIEVPALGPGRMTLEQSLARLRGAVGPVYDLARDQLANVLNRAEALLVKQQVKHIVPPYAGTVLKKNTEPERFIYEGTPFQRFAANMAGALRSPITRGAADVAATTPVPDGAPVGAYPLAGLAKQAGVPAAEMLVAP